MQEAIKLQCCNTAFLLKFASAATKLLEGHCNYRFWCFRKASACAINAKDLSAEQAERQHVNPHHCTFTRLAMEGSMYGKAEAAHRPGHQCECCKEQRLVPELSPLVFAI